MQRHRGRHVSGGGRLVWLELNGRGGGRRDAPRVSCRVSESVMKYIRGLSQRVTQADRFFNMIAWLQHEV